MTQQRYQIVFKGEVLAGFDPLESRALAARLLKAEPSQIAQLFSGQEVGIRRGLSAAEAARYRTALSRVGLRIYVNVMPLAISASTQTPGTIAPCFRVIYSGEVLQGQSRQAVMRRVGQKLRLDNARLSRLFSGKKAILKQGLSAEAAARYLAEAAQLGMLASMECEIATPRTVHSAVAKTVAASKTELEKRFMESAAKTQLYAPRAPLYDKEVKRHAVTAGHTSTIIDIDITRALAAEPFDPVEEPMPQVKTWRPSGPTATRNAESVPRTDPAVSAGLRSSFVPAIDQAGSALSSIELHAASITPPSATKPAIATKGSGALQRLVTMRSLLPRVLARILH